MASHPRQPADLGRSHSKIARAESNRILCKAVHSRGGMESQFLTTGDTDGHR